MFGLFQKQVEKREVIKHTQFGRFAVVQYIDRKTGTVLKEVTKSGWMARRKHWA